MPFSSGTFSLYTPGNPVVAGTTISTSWAQNTLNDIATGLTTCVLKDGSQTITANIPMASFKFTGLGAGSALTDSANLRQVQYGFGSFLTAVGGTANAITATATPTPEYTVGQRFTFVPASTNTGATTLNISGVGAGAVQWVGAALTGGELVAGTAVTVYVTAATPVFEIVAPTQFPDSRALVVGATDATKKLRIEADGITTGTTRVWTAPDFDFTLGAVVQRTFTSYATNTDLSTALPNDDTIPQNTEGVEIMTQAITPKSASNRIRIRFQAFGDNNTNGGSLSVALFVDTTANALCASLTQIETATRPQDLVMEYEESAASTSARTYKIRVGGNAGTVVRLNGSSSARIFGGVAVATLIIEEIS